MIDADGRLEPAADALTRAGLEPIKLGPKEGLSLINGTDGMLGMLVLAYLDLLVLCRTADVAAAMSIEALLGTDAAFDTAVQELRPHVGQRMSAANLRRLMANSEIVASHTDNDDRVQDAYSMRCAPQVHGAARDVPRVRLRGVAEVELDVCGRQPERPGRDGRLVSTATSTGYLLAFARRFPW